MKLWISLSAVALITTEELWPLNLRNHVFDNVTFTNWLDYCCSMASHDLHNNMSYFNITTTSLKKNMSIKFEHDFKNTLRFQLIVLRAP